MFDAFIKKRHSYTKKSYPLECKRIAPVFVIETPTLQSHVGGYASRVAIVSCKVIWFCDAGRVPSYTLISWR